MKVESGVGEQSNLNTNNSTFSRSHWTSLKILLSIAHTGLCLRLVELCKLLAYYTEETKMKDLSNKTVSPVPRTNSSDLHPSHFQTVPSSELRTQKKTGLSFDSFLSPSFST